VKNRWRAFDRMLPKIGCTVLLVLLVLVVLVLVAYVRLALLPARTGPDDVAIADPTAAVRDARALIANPSAHADWLTPEQLPPSLRLPHLHHANVHDDHVDLILGRNPDVSIGARIWATQHRPHHDRPLRYRDVWFYRYDNDVAVSVDNPP
jgi:hypothetical protein